MTKTEAAIVALCAAAMIGLLFVGIVGWLVATAWAGYGLWLVSQSRSRGLLADASFVLTWPVYMALER